MNKKKLNLRQLSDVERTEVLESLAVELGITEEPTKEEGTMTYAEKLAQEMAEIYGSNMDAIADTLDEQDLDVLFDLLDQYEGEELRNNIASYIKSSIAAKLEVVAAERKDVASAMTRGDKEVTEMKQKVRIRAGVQGQKEQTGPNKAGHVIGKGLIYAGIGSVAVGSGIKTGSKAVAKFTKNTAAPAIKKGSIATKKSIWDLASGVRDEIVDYKEYKKHSK